MFGALHDRVVIVDMAKESDDAKNVGIINRVKNGLGFAACADNVGASEPGKMLREGGLAERGDDAFKLGNRSFTPVGKFVQNAKAFGIAHRPQDRGQF